MRLPLFKMYRAFPEFDRFSDKQCAGLMRRVNSRWVSRALLASLCTVLAIITFLLTIFFLRLFFVTFADLIGLDHLVTMLIFVVAMVAVPAYAVISVRDTWLRRKLRGLIDSTNCACGYSLLGLRAPEGRVTCPECGSVTELDEIGVASEQILASTPEASLQSGTDPQEP